MSTTQIEMAGVRPCSAAEAVERIFPLLSFVARVVRCAELEVAFAFRSSSSMMNICDTSVCERTWSYLRLSFYADV
jgi:hypothetical protein